THINIHKPKIDNALVNISNILSMNWVLDINNVCNFNAGMECENNVVTRIYITTVSPPQQIPDELFILENLTSIEIVGLTLGTSFWDNISQKLQSIGFIYISEVTEPLPTNLGMILPRSLTNMRLLKTNYSIPVSLFTHGNFDELTLATDNSDDFDVFPHFIPTPNTALVRLIIKAYPSFVLAGNNFTVLSDLTIEFAGPTNTMTYNAFDSFPALTILRLAFNAEIPTFDIKSSIFNIPKLIALQMLDNQRVILPSQTLNFTNSPNISTFDIQSSTMLDQLVYPGFILVNQMDGLYATGGSVVDLSKFNVFLFKDITFYQSTIVGDFPDGNYSQSNKIEIQDGYNGVIPNSFCLLPGGVQLVRTGITSVPTCFQCDWGTENVNLFIDNSGLPVYTPNCPNLDVVSNTGKINTFNGVMIIEGTDLGWIVYSETGVALNTSVMVGNEKLKIPIPEGTGRFKNIVVKFHFVADAATAPFTLDFDYQGPTISSIAGSESKLVLFGENFGVNKSVITLIAAGRQLGVNSVTHGRMESDPGFIMYDSNITLSVQVLVDGQEYYQTFDAGQPVLYQPLPVLYSTGGYVEFYGEYLTFDTTLMNMTMGDQVLSNQIQQSTSTFYLIKYDPIPVGQYPLVFNQLGYQLSTVVTVRDADSIPCKGTPICGGPSKGICIDNKCECVSPWRGEICDSTPIIIPPLDPNTSEPSVNSTDGKIALYITILSIRELDYNGAEVREEHINQWIFSQNATGIEKKSYVYETSLFLNCKVTVTVDYFNQDSKVSFANVNSTKLAGSIKYSVTISHWPFLMKTNQLQLVFSTSIEDTEDSDDTCSYKAIEYEDDNQKKNVRIVDIQVGDRTLSSTFSDLAVIDGVVRKIKNVLVTLSNDDEDANSESQSYIGITTPYHSNYITIDPDFNLMISYVEPQDKEGSVCASPKSGLTKAQLAGIILASVVVFIGIIIAIAYIYISKSLKTKIFLYKIKSKLSL
ncbi:hypothetical protein DLAC_04997, partial [Tieghemostelium lacteum]